MNTFIFKNPSCKTCEHWQPSEFESHSRKVALGRCDHLDNDFCCGGKSDHEAGVLGGGYFLSKETFWCKFWSQK